MSLLIVILAIAGGVILAVRLMGAAGRAALCSAEAAAAAGTIVASARRGDLTRLSEGQAAERDARARRRRFLLLGTVWLLWLGLPPVFGWVPEAYALASPLWLIPKEGPGLRSNFKG